MRFCARILAAGRSCECICAGLITCLMIMCGPFRPKHPPSSFSLRLSGHFNHGVHLLVAMPRHEPGPRQLQAGDDLPLLQRDDASASTITSRSPPAVRSSKRRSSMRVLLFTPGWYWNEQQASTVPRVGWCVGWDWWHGEAPHGSARLSSARLRSAQHQHESPNSSDGTTLELEAGSALLALE